MNAKDFLKSLFEKALGEMSPEKAAQRSVSLHENDILQIKDRSFDIKDRPIYLFATGKAAVPMSQSLLDILGERLTDLLVIAPDVSAIPEPYGDKVIAGSHPTPNGDSLDAGKRAVDFFKNVPGDALLLSLISGGTSSLMCLPAESISIDDLNETHQLLINSGAAIHEINAVRKHCSQIKGGQLLRNLDASVSLVNLVISDVPDDNLEDIGSGPTVPDSSTFRDARRILQERELWEKIPASVRRHIEKGLVGEAIETVKKDEHPLKEHHSFIISSARMLAETAAGVAEKDGYHTWIADRPFTGDVEQVAEDIANHTISVAEQNEHMELPALLVYYGESTVKVTGSGKGGRNQELALHGAQKIAGYEQITWLSAGTDGIDGPTDAAGAVVDWNTIQLAKERGVKADEYLSENDSYHFHEKLGTLLKTGPTGNNLMDVVLVLIQKVIRS